MIAHTDLTLFQNTKFYKHQNYKIDDIATFLSGFTDKLEFEDLQYFKVDSLQKEIKISFNQKGIKDLHKYNYARVVIINNDETTEWTLYYFVDKVEWISMDCVKLHMTLDTLNSFLDMLEFHPKTYIEREHCDRWNYDAYTKISYGAIEYNAILREIPELNEGLNPQKYAYNITSQELYPININCGYYISEKSVDSLLSHGWAMVSLGLQSILSISEFNHYDLTCFVPFSPFGAYFYVKGAGSLNAEQTTPFANIDTTNQKLISIYIIPYAPNTELSEYYKFTESSPFTQQNGYEGIFLQKDKHGIDFCGVSPYFRENGEIPKITFQNMHIKRNIHIPILKN